jgi:cytidine deaminase
VPSYYMAEQALKTVMEQVTAQAAQPRPTLPEAEMRQLTNAVNDLITTVVRIIITHDADECASENKYNRPCETCQAISELKGPAKTIIRLSEKMRKMGGGG